ncbi:cytochrome c-type biogenesis protein CcmH [Salinisphaera sp. T31B1]
MGWLWLCLSLALLAGAAGAATVGDTTLTDAQLARYHSLNAELRCLICQNRTIAESDAPLAKDLRDIVARQLAAGRSDAQIKQYLVDRYGEWVLYDPPLQTSTLILWLGPFALLLFGLAVVMLIMRGRRRSPAAPPALDRQRLARVLEGHSPSPDHRAADPDKDRS